MKSIWDFFVPFFMLIGHIKLNLDKCLKWNIWIITFLSFDKCSFTYAKQRITSWKINEFWHIKSIFFPLIFLSVFGLDFEVRENVIMHSKHNYVFLEKRRHYLIAQMALVRYPRHFPHFVLVSHPNWTLGGDSGLIHTGKIEMALQL